jgi:malyl-CoA/(S)-citramalyl-CoA lyase
MSFTIPPSPPARPNRCQLFGPGSRPELFAKMATSAADVINIDLEDSVSPADKDSARANTIKAITEIDWGKKTLSVRINGLDTAFWYRDVVDLMEQTGERLDLIMIPKAGNAKDIYAVDALVSSIEAAKGRKKRLGFEAIIETAMGFANVQDVAKGSPRLQSLHLGAADFAASASLRPTSRPTSDTSTVGSRSAGTGRWATCSVTAASARGRPSSCREPSGSSRLA